MEGGKNEDEVHSEKQSCFSLEWRKMEEILGE